jgi:hypothetical protein
MCTRARPPSPQCTSLQLLQSYLLKSYSVSVRISLNLAQNIRKWHRPNQLHLFLRTNICFDASQLLLVLPLSSPPVPFRYSLGFHLHKSVLAYRQHRLAKSCLCRSPAFPSDPSCLSEIRTVFEPEGYSRHRLGSPGTMLATGRTCWQTRC